MRGLGAGGAGEEESEEGGDEVGVDGGAGVCREDVA